MCCTGGACFSLCSVPCSESVGAAACNPIICANCTTGALPGGFFDGANNSPVAGSPVCICLPPAPCLCDVPSVLNIPPGCTAPESPLTEGTTDQPPAPANCQCAKGLNPGSGAGSARSSSGGGGAPIGGGSRPHISSPCTNLAKTSSILNRLGTSLASLLGGGQRVPIGSVLPGQAVPKRAGVISQISPNAFLLIIVVVGILLLMMAFGKGGGNVNG